MVANTYHAGIVRLTGQLRFVRAGRRARSTTTVLMRHLGETRRGGAAVRARKRHQPDGAARRRGGNLTTPKQGLPVVADVVRPGSVTPRPDLDTRLGIDRLMIAFYAKATTDDLIGEFFTDVISFDLRHHLPVIGDFWESVLLGTQAYRAHNRSPLQLHTVLDALRPLHPEHFDRWLELFGETVDEHFAGPRAEFAKQRSGMIARRMLEVIAAARLAAAASR